MKIEALDHVQLARRPGGEAEAARRRVRRDDALAHVPRLVTEDPFGHRIELLVHAEQAT